MLLGLDEASSDAAVKIMCPAVERASVAVHSPA
jgi:LacI family transcriptional regulator